MRALKEKKERSLGEHLHLKGRRCESPKCAMIRKPYRPGMHGKRRAPALSDFGKQIREKQKFKVSYGVPERNLRRLFVEAKKKSGSVAARLLELLERRLDNVIYRLGFALSRGMARQLVNHGHIFVNGRRVRSPGYEVRVNDVISIRPASVEKAALKEMKELLGNHEPPEWLRVDKEKCTGQVIANPVSAESPFEINLLVESFSK